MLIVLDSTITLYSEFEACRKNRVEACLKGSNTSIIRLDVVEYFYLVDIFQKSF